LKGHAQHNVLVKLYTVDNTGTPTHDITVDGPELAAQAIRAGIVDEFQLIVCPAIGGGGKRFFPDGVRLDLELLEERRLTAAWSSCGTAPVGLLVRFDWAWSLPRSLRPNNGLERISGRSSHLFFSALGGWPGRNPPNLFGAIHGRTQSLFIHSIPKTIPILERA
jgi:hypothetical protein